MMKKIFYDDHTIETIMKGTLSGGYSFCDYKQRKKCEKEQTEDSMTCLQDCRKFTIEIKLAVG